MIRAYNAKQWEVRAILDGRKSCIRIAVKYKYSNTEMKIKSDKYGSRLIEIQKDVEGGTYGKNPDGSTWHRLLPYIEKIPPYKKGDILYVRETIWQKTGHYLDVDGETKAVWCNEFRYAASDEKPEVGWNYSWGKRPSIHMPKEAARIWLKVTDVSVEQLQKIDEDGVAKEGLEPRFKVKDKFSGNIARGRFLELWNSTIKKSDLDRYGWDANPYVFVIEFERCEKPEGV